MYSLNNDSTLEEQMFLKNNILEKPLFLANLLVLKKINVSKNSPPFLKITSLMM